MKRRYAVPVVAAITALSGFCSLVYQVVWDRTVKYNFGGDSISSAIVTGTFLLGLGLGAYLFGRRWRDAYRTYGLVELAIGGFGILSFYLISPVAATLAHVLKATPEQVEGLRPAVVVGCILLLLPPCTLIGGTLPLMFECFVRPLRFSARSIGFIYGVNTLGASIGILAVPLLFLNRLSLPHTLWIVGGINVALGLLILLWARRRLGGAGRDSEAPSETAGAPAPERGLRGLVYGIAFVSGFVALGFEVSLFRAFQIVNPSSAYNFPLVLVLFLLALATGSIVFTREIAEDRDRILWRVGWLLAASAVAMFASIWIAALLRANEYPVSFMPILYQGDLANVPWVLIFSAVLVMPVPLLTGAIFPLLLRLHASSEAGLPEATGKVYLSNSLGSFGGAILGTFAGFPLLGTRGFLTLLYLVSCALGIGLLIGAGRLGKGQATLRPRAVAAVVLAMAVVVVTVMPADVWSVYVTGGAEPNWEVREGATGVAQIFWNDGTGGVRVNGQYMSRLPHHPRHVKQEVFLLTQSPRARVLVLGIGGAGILRSLVEDAEVEEIHAVDWSYELPDLLSGGQAAELLRNALTSPKVTILKADARVAVGLYEPESFDLVFDNLAFASWAGSSSIKSATYFRKIRTIVKPGGVFATGTNYLGADRFAVLAGLVSAFESVQEHLPGEVVISAARRPTYSDERILAVATPRAPVFNLGHLSPAALIDWFRSGFVDFTESDLEGARPIRDDLLIHEYFWDPLQLR